MRLILSLNISGLSSSRLQAGETTYQHEEMAEFPAELKQLRLQVNSIQHHRFIYRYFRQFNFKDVKAKKTGQKMFFRPDELLAAYPSGSKAHNYKIAKTPQIKKENKKLMTCTALETQELYICSKSFPI